MYRTLSVWDRRCAVWCKRVVPLKDPYIWKELSITPKQIAKGIPIIWAKVVYT